MINTHCLLNSSCGWDILLFSVYLIATSNSTAGQNMAKKMQRPQLPSDLASAPNTSPPGWACFLTYEEHIPTSGLPPWHSFCLECFSHTGLNSCSLISSGSLLKRCLTSRGFPLITYQIVSPLLHSPSLHRFWWHRSLRYCLSNPVKTVPSWVGEKLGV